MISQSNNNKKAKMNTRRMWGIILLAIYVALCLVISVWQFAEGFSTLRDMAQSTVEPTAQPLETPSATKTPDAQPTAYDTADATPPVDEQAALSCAHEYGPWETVIQATTTSNGLDNRVCALCGAIDTRVTNSTPTIDTSPGNASIGEMFDLINAVREAAGLPTVYYCDDIQAAADLRAAELNEYYDMQHNRPDGREAVTVFYDLGITYSMLGENYTLGPQSTEQAMLEFMNSDSHRALIMSESAVGVAISVAPNDEFGLSWVQIFIK